MIIYPAVDILKGKCVRLTEGVKDDSTVYYENPVDAAMMWEQKGAKWLHIIDLDGAFDGKPSNTAVLEAVIKKVRVPVQIGGGLRTIQDIDTMLNIGAARVIIGTAAVMDDEIVELCSKKYADKLIVSIDAKDGYVATDGWVNISQFSAYNFAQKLVYKGLKNFVYTDISRDGTMKGPNFNGIEKMCSVEHSKIIASGGVKGVEDILTIKSLGASGAIIGKALYNGSIKLEEALAVCEAAAKEV